MAPTFSVKNFSEFQHYKDRSPPWIKLYNKLLDDYDFGALPDVSKAHLLAIWLLASRYENRIPLDPDWIARRINATERVDLTVLVEAGFLIVDQHCSEMLAERKQPACPEREAEGEREGEREGGAVAQKEYVFEGKVIRVTAKNLAEWEVAYPYVRDHIGELRLCDAYLVENPSTDGKWFFRASSWLKKANDDARPKEKKTAAEIIAEVCPPHIYGGIRR